jgi:hypothetical protein
MIESKFLHSYVIKTENDEFLVFYDHEDEIVYSIKNLSDEEKNIIKTHLIFKFYKNNIPEINIEMTFNQIKAMKNDITKRKDQDVGRRNKI